METPLAEIGGLAAVALAAGVVDAIAGGGGLLTLPALLLTGLPVPAAVGTNKGQAVFGSGSALLTFWHAGRIDPRRVPALFLSGFMGSLLGAHLVTLLAPAVLRPVVLALLVVVATVLALQPRIGQSPRPVDGPLALRAMLIGAGIGCYDGFFGPGTGTFLILAQVAWLGDDMTRASAHAKIVNFSSNLAAMLLLHSKGLVHWDLAVPMAVAQTAGSIVGARLAVGGGDRLVRKVVLVVVALLVAKLTWDLTQ